MEEVLEPGSPHHLHALLNRIEHHANHLAYLSTHHHGTPGRQRSDSRASAVTGLDGTEDEDDDDVIVPAFHELVLSCQHLLHQAVYFLKMDQAEALDTDSIKTVKAASRAVSEYLKEIGVTVKLGRRQQLASGARSDSGTATPATTSAATPYIESNPLPSSSSQRITSQMQTIVQRSSVLCRILLNLGLLSTSSLR